MDMLNILITITNIRIRWDMWYKISNLSKKKGFDRELVFNDKYIKTKINLHNNKIQIFMVIKYQKKMLCLFVCVITRFSY